MCASAISSTTTSSRCAAVAIAFATLLGCAGCTEPRPDSFALREVATGAYVHFGAQEDASVANLDAIANVGFVVGSRCVAVIDTGGSRAEGDRLRAAIAATTQVPVCYVINTHMHPDHVLGNAAFAADVPQFIGHAKLPAALAARSASYLRALERELGPQAAGTTAVAPTRTVAQDLELDLGGRVLDLRAWPTAHTDNDLTVLDRATGTLWAGDLLFADRIPVIDGSINGWIAVGEELGHVDAAHVVPGHGPMREDWHAQLAAQQRYLLAVRDGTRAAIRAHQTIGRASATVAREEAARWLLFESYHARNVTAAYAELEWED